jgi:uncharacterized YigZ family protein
LPFGFNFSEIFFVDTLSASVHAETLIKKSRFIACVEPCAGRPEALARVAALRAQHPQAAHVCWALLAGGQSAANDDGEPSGTAGRPMLDVLRHQSLEGVLATVVRYFGGVKLGAGGLVRAYTDAVVQALRDAQRTRLVPMVPAMAELPPSLEGLLRRELAAAGWELESAEHGAQVTLQLRLPADGAKALASALDEACQGRIGWLTPNPDA